MNTKSSDSNANPSRQRSEKLASDPPGVSALEPDQTLRLLTAVEPPPGLADRVHERLRMAASAQPKLQLKSQLLSRFWGGWLTNRPLQFAGAATLVLAVAASTWGVHHSHMQRPGAVLHTTHPGGEFKSAGTERRPSTLTPIKVPPVHKKRPRALRVKPAWEANPSKISPDPPSTSPENP